MALGLGSLTLCGEVTTDVWPQEQGGARLVSAGSLGRPAASPCERPVVSLQVPATMPS